MEIADPRRLLARIAKILNELQIPYIITGGMAVLVWGRPRFTADIDIVVELREANIGNLERSLRALGKTGYIDRNAMEHAILTKGEFNFIDGTTGVKVDFWMLLNDPFDASRLKRKVRKTIAGEPVYFTSPEDLILIKLQWYKDSQSSRQREDVESILKISGDSLDMEYLAQWAKKLGVQEILDQVITTS